MLIAKLDYELIQRFTLTVIARDGGGEETTGRVRINVLDVNDNVPTFQKDAYVGALRENEPSVTQLVRLRVRCQAFLQSGHSCYPQPVPSSWRFPWKATARAANSITKKSTGFGGHVLGLCEDVPSCPWLPSAASACLSLDFIPFISLGKCEQFLV